MATTEQWREVIGYGGAYLVSDMGRVRSEARTITRHGRPTRLRQRFLKLQKNTSGYPCAPLARNGVTTKIAVHVLVLEAFICPRPVGLEACHNNGDRADPRLSNLRWDTRLANAADRIAHGTDARGEKFYAPKVSAVDVEAIRSDMRAQDEIARQYGLHQSTISLIKSRKRWAHQPERISP